MKHAPSLTSPSVSLRKIELDKSRISSRAHLLRKVCEKLFSLVSIESLGATFLNMAFFLFFFFLSMEARGISMERTRPRLIESHYFYYVQYTGVEWFLLIHIDTIERYYIICTSHITYSRIWNVAAYPRKRSLRSFLSSLNGSLSLRGVESWKNNRHDCTDCTSEEPHSVC